MLILLFWLFIFIYADARGPHHPIDSVSHHHYHPKPKGDKFLQDKELLHDQKHIAEDIGEEWQVDPKLSEEELEFMYFKVHDLDKNAKLDGLEIYQAIKHSVDSAERASKDTPYIQGKTEDIIIKLIDRALEENDIDQDGYLTYAEYIGTRENDKNKTVSTKVDYGHL